MFTPTQLKTILLTGKVIGEKELALLETNAKKTNQPLESYLIEKKIVSEELLYTIAATVLGLPFVDLHLEPIVPEVLALIPEPLATKHALVAFKKEADTLHVATTQPSDLKTQELLQKKLGTPLRIFLTTPASLQSALKQYHKEGLAQEVTKDISVSIIRLVDTIISHAVREGASDIHIEPEEKDLLIRFRVDGILRQIMTLPKTVQAGITARIKVLANLKIDEHRLPQDGRFKITTPQGDVSFRVSIIPVYDGEKIVLRLLHESGRILSLEELGFGVQGFARVKTAIAKPHGMILVTGPTGSGKTTTLYTILHLLNHPGVNIITIEDPIEYRIPGVNQTQVSPKVGFTFANGLRSFLRQDPNIMMVGEIRDQETAEISIHSALTGHLVLSTLHTNDAITTIARLLDMGIPPFLLASTLVLIVAQRLVRKICPDCISSYTLDKKAIAQLEQHFDMKMMLKIMAREKAIASEKEELDSLLFYRGKGCSRCHKDGYKGRIGVYEVLEISPAMTELILERPSRETLREQAEKDQMVTLAQDGFIKAKNGVTTIEELLRVTKE